MAVGHTDRVAVAVAAFGGCGFFPWAPATFASAVTAALLALAGALPVTAPVVAGLVALLLVGVWSCGRSERHLGTDPSAAVLDEVLGMCLAVLGLELTPAVLVIGFLFFRIFDVLKIPPGRAVERLHGGWGIMLDDVVAGLYARLALAGVLVVWPEPALHPWHAIPVVALSLLGWRFRRPLMRRYGKARSDARSVFGRS